MTDAPSYRRDVPLAPFTTWNIGGPAEFLFEPQSVDDLTAAADWARERGLGVVVLGRGSNTLIADEGVPGAVICLRTGPAAIEVDGATLRAEAGCPLPKIAVTAQRHGLGGFEFMIGIPGTVGAGVAINAGIGGADGTAIDSVLRSATLYDPASGERASVDAADLGLRYRGSDVPCRGAWVLDARFEGAPGDPAAILERQRAIQRARAAKQPLQRHTSGSVFKQVDGGRAAGWYIDRAGLKGERVGGASVSETHANWIENDGSATARDVRRLMERVRSRVREAFGVELEREVRFLPEDARHLRERCETSRAAP